MSGRGEFSKGDLRVITEGSKVIEVLYRGKDMRLSLKRAILDRLEYRNLTRLDMLTDSLLSLAREIDQSRKNYTLSVALTDFYFDAYTKPWRSKLDSGNLIQATSIMQIANLAAWEWENRNRGYRIHKGTPYFHLGEAYVFMGNYDLAFLMLHNAIEEDKQTYPKLNADYRSGPAYLFVSLNPSYSNSALYPQVLEMRNFVAVNCKFTGTIFDQAQFEKKFLQNPAFEYETFLFVYCMMQIQNMERFPFGSLQINAFTELKFTQILFELCLIIDKILREQFATKSMGAGILKLLSKIENIPEHKPQELFAEIHYRNGEKLDMRDSSDKVVPNLIAGWLQYRGQALTPLMAALLGAWNIRNHGGHNVGGTPLITRHTFGTTLNLILSALYLTVLHLQ